MITFGLAACCKKHDKSEQYISVNELFRRSISDSSKAYPEYALYHYLKVKPGQSNPSFDDFKSGITVLPCDSIQALLYAYYISRAESVLSNRLCFDDRLDIVACPTAIKDASAGILTIYDPEFLDSVQENGGVYYKFQDYRNTGSGNYPLCSGEIIAPFRGQLVAGTGTAFAIDDNLIVTAGHNLPAFGNKCRKGPVEGMAFVFDFRIDSTGAFKNRIRPDQILRPADCLYCSNDPDGIDLAILRTDQKIKPHRQLKISSIDPAECDSVYMIGHPEGLPQKFSGVATIDRMISSTRFSAELDAFNANSGSPVFNLQHEVVGILVNGTDLQDQLYKLCDGTICSFPSYCKPPRNSKCGHRPLECNMPYHFQNCSAVEIIHASTLRKALQPLSRVEKSTDD